MPGLNAVKVNEVDCRVDSQCELRIVAVLFAQKRSVYHAIDGVDVWDAERDARLWPGGSSVVAHPPCRSWGNLKGLAKPRPDERDLARFSIAAVRTFGGVLEHPANSSLWSHAGLPRPGSRDGFGFCTSVLQKWWGHNGDKATWLYVVGVAPGAFPEIPFSLAPAAKLVENMCRQERERTPVRFAEWLVELARRAV